MSRKMYQLTKSQERKIRDVEMPSDDWFKANRGRRPWGLFKRDWIIGNMKYTREYQLGLGQGRVDKANGLPYSEERTDSAYNLGYYRGYTDYESNRRGWDQATRERFDAQYVG